MSEFTRCEVAVLRELIEREQKIIDLRLKKRPLHVPLILRRAALDMAADRLKAEQQPLQFGDQA